MIEAIFWEISTVQIHQLSTIRKCLNMGIQPAFQLVAMLLGVASTIGFGAILIQCFSYQSIKTIGNALVMSIISMAIDVYFWIVHGFPCFFPYFPIYFPICSHVFPIFSTCSHIFPCFPPVFPNNGHFPNTSGWNRDCLPRSPPPSARRSMAAERSLTAVVQIMRSRCMSCGGRPFRVRFGRGEPSTNGPWLP